MDYLGIVMMLHDAATMVQLMWQHALVNFKKKCMNAHSDPGIRSALGGWK